MTQIRGFYLDPESHDLALDAGGRITFLDGANAAQADAATAQEIKTRLLFFKGENFADAREGVPYFQEILRKGVALSRVRAIVQRVIRSHPAIVDVPVCTVTLDRVTRAASIVFQARTLAGRLIRSDDFPPLVIT